MTVTVILFLSGLVLIAYLAKAVSKTIDAVNEEREAFNSLLMFLGTKFEDMEIEDFVDGKKKR